MNRGSSVRQDDRAFLEIAVYFCCQGAGVASVTNLPAAIEVKFRENPVFINSVIRYDKSIALFLAGFFYYIYS